MSELDNFLAKTSQKNNIGGLDDFAKKYFAPVNTTPAENVNVSAGEAPTGTDVQPGILANAFRDIRNKVGQWWEGAKAGASEVVKAAQQMPVSMSSAEVPGGAGLTPADQSAIEYNQKAVGNFTNETIKPAAYTVGLAVPAAAAPFIVADAANIGKDQGVGAVAKEFSGYNAIAKAAENPLDVWMRFYNEPVTTAAELLPAFIVGRSGLKAAKGGLKSVREAIDTKASTALDKFLADTVPESAGKTTEQPTSVQGAIASQESGGNYNALNKDSGAAGKYQIMPENWPSWSEEAGLGRDAEMTPANQDRVAAFKMNQYSEMFGGDQRLVAAAWYAGPDYAKSLQEGKPLYNPNARFNGEGKVDPNGQYPSVNEYVDSVVGKMDNQGLRVASPDEVVAEETAAPAVKAKKDVDMTSIEADKILDDSKSNYGTPGKYDLSNIEKSPQNWYVSEYNNKGSDGVVGVVGVKGSPESYEIKDPATFKAIQEKFTENPNDEATMREIANNALANQDFTTAADMYEKLGSLQVAAQLRKVAKIHQTEQLNMVVPKETDTDAIRSEQQTPILARTAHDEQLQMANKAPEVEASAQSVTPVMKSEILKDIENLFTKVWVGRVNRKNVLGWFNTRTEAIRLKDFGDLQTVAHEVGHFLDEKQLKLANGVYEAEKLLPKQDRVMESELQALGQETSQKGYTTPQIRQEGVAEFMREYITNKLSAEAKAPNFYRFFENSLGSNPEIKAGIDQLSEKVGRWYGQAPEARARSGVSFGYEAPKPSILQRAKDTWMMAYEKLVDAKVGLDTFVKKYQQQLGEKVVSENDPYKLSRVAQTGATARAEMLVDGKNPGLVRETINKFYNGILQHDVTIRSIFDKLENAGADMAKEYPEYLARGNFKDWREAFDAYIVARRQIEIQKTRPEYRGPMSNQDAAAMVNNAPKQFEGIAKDFYDYGDNILRIAKDGGLISQELYDTLKNKYQNYASMARDFSDEAAGGGLFGSGKGFANVRKAIKSLSDEGSNRTVVSPLESMIRNTYVTLNLVERNRVGQTFAKLAEKQGAGEFVEAVTGAGDANKSIFTVWIDGERKAFQTTPDIYRAIMSMNEEGANFLTKLLSAPAGWLRAGATLSPEFIVKNLTRDAFSAAIYSKAGFIPGYDTLKGLAKVMGNERALYEYKASGAMMSTLTSVDRTTMSKEINNYIKNKPNINPLDVLRALNDLGESATRLAEYTNVRGKGGSILDATLAAKDVTIDFSRAGTWGKGYNRIAAFFNAGIQGVDRLARAFREDPLQTSGRIAMYITAPSVLLWLYTHDDVRYQELPAYQRDLFWCIPTGGVLTREEFDRLLKSGKSKQEILDKAGPIIRIPKPFEPGIFFGSGAERFLDWCVTHDMRGVKEWAKSAKDGLLPNLAPTVAVPLVEWMTNYSFFSDRPIVPEREQKLPPHLQYGPQTSEVAKYIGEKTDQSPRLVENTIRGWTGGLGGAGLSAVDMATGSTTNRPAQKWYEQPWNLVGRAIVTPAFRSPESVKNFYDTKNQQEQFFNELKMTGKVPEGFNPGQYGATQGIGKTMEDLNKLEKAIMADKKMSPTEKRQQIDYINMMQIMFSRQATK